ncbi:MAG TPA: PaaI family thioesterase [Magnetospirillaceae bacterium]|nr:PaaI family thioesterase [Magnetospirillaceae bacterium]
MPHVVIRKQNNSRMCFVCGIANDFGLRASFYETEGGELVARIRPGEQHQGYPGRMHGGVAAAILDETIGRAMALGKDDRVWGVTVELSTKYRKPILLDRELWIVGRVTSEGPRFFEGSGEIILQDGEVAVSASGRYLKVSLDRITGSEMGREDWFLRQEPWDPLTIEIPGRQPPGRQPPGR